MSWLRLLVSLCILTIYDPLFLCSLAALSNLFITTLHPCTFSVLCSDVPDPPENVKCTGVGEDSASIQWDPPEFDGGVPVKGKTDPRYLCLSPI